MATGYRRAAAAHRRRLAERIRQISDDPAVHRAQRRHESRRVPDDLLVGMDAPAARTPGWRGFLAAVPVLPLARLARARSARPAVADLRARGATGGSRLVDGG